MCPQSVDLVAAVRSALDDLRKLSNEELYSLPGQSEPSGVDEQHASMAVWHNIRSSQIHQIIVQGVSSGILGVRRAYAEGFEVAPDGSRRDMNPEELAEYF